MTTDERAAGASDDARLTANDAGVLAAEAEREAEDRTPYGIACDLEESVSALGDYAEVLAMMSHDLPREQNGALFRISRDIAETVQTVKEGREALFHALHPSRAKLDAGPEPKPDDGGPFWGGALFRLGMVDRILRTRNVGAELGYDREAADRVIAACTRLTVDYNEGEPDTFAAEQAVRHWADYHGISLDWLLTGKVEGLIVLAAGNSEAMLRAKGAADA
ncbi:hypothetical protein A33M_2904 [Rhodovulum sp. PH10]|uniref:hypothetical protein n=1 Tax=Rhodovulum sp. PH10 TaxID=1187851 RepID=UPI00027C2B40|nr:hypothetical protein [Rhodovulum sp. PH10]EJW11707.1 hypothetical protein A33M_2904 [Rhodovulum sp. PH10]